MMNCYGYLRNYKTSLYLKPELNHIILLLNTLDLRYCIKIRVM